MFAYPTPVGPSPEFVVSVEKLNAVEFVVIVGRTRLIECRIPDEACGINVHGEGHYSR